MGVTQERGGIKCWGNQGVLKGYHDSSKKMADRFCQDNFAILILYENGIKCFIAPGS